jgi:hypothetical protein
MTSRKIKGFWTRIDSRLPSALGWRWRASAFQAVTCLGWGTRSVATSTPSEQVGCETIRGLA